MNPIAPIRANKIAEQMGVTLETLVRNREQLPELKKIGRFWFWYPVKHGDENEGRTVEGNAQVEGRNAQELPQPNLTRGRGKTKKGMGRRERTGLDPA